jgi:glycosyltransferase involved in cell wall biosynthesis
MKRALICAPTMPEFDRDSGGRRLFDLARLLRAADWSVSLFARSSSPGQARYARALRQLGVAVYAGDHAMWVGDEFTWSIDQLLTHGQFDLAILAFWHTAERYVPAIRLRSPRTRIAIDTIDLNFLRGSRRLLQGQPGARGRLDGDFGREFARELNAYGGADALLMVSQKEADLIGEFLGGQPPAHVVPLLEDIPASPVSFEQRRGILFLGSFRHPPNVEAVQHLCQEVLPHLPPDVLERHPVYIVGNGLDERIARFGAGQPQVRMVGWAPSVTPYLHRTCLTVLPLLHGAGTKGKLIQALVAGIPSVSTTIGIEGLDLDHERHVLVADDARAFAAAIERLVSDQALWGRLASAGRAHAVERHGLPAVRTALLNTVECILTSVESEPPTMPVPALWRAGNQPAHP